MVLLDSSTKWISRVLSGGLFCPTVLKTAVWRMRLADQMGQNHILVIMYFKLVFRNKNCLFGLLSSKLLPSPVLCQVKQRQNFTVMLLWAFYPRAGDIITRGSSAGDQSSTDSLYLSCELINVYLLPYQQLPCKMTSYSLQG